MELSEKFFEDRYNEVQKLTDECISLIDSNPNSVTKTELEIVLKHLQYTKAKIITDKIFWESGLL